MARMQVLGTNGNDELNEGPQAASDIFGFGGDDQIFLNRSDDLGGDNFVDAGSGNDQVLNQFEGGNEILLGSGNDTYVGLGFASGPGGFDVVRGGDGNDTIAVSTFRSEYFGGRGTDKFFSIGWQNDFDGGTGRDTITYELRDEDSTLGGSGVGVDLAAGLAFTGASRTERLAGIENVIGTGFADELFGGAGGNRLEGRRGGDSLGGEGGNDFLFGGNGNDGLDGGAQNDVLTGGLGFDVLFGGSGADRFDFNLVTESTANANRDRVQDFSRAELDKIDVSGIDANGRLAGEGQFVFVGAAAFGSTPGQLRFSGGILSGTTDADAAAEFQIAVSGLSSMQAGDFVL